MQAFFLAAALIAQWDFSPAPSEPAADSRWEFSPQVATVTKWDLSPRVPQPTLEPLATGEAAPTPYSEVVRVINLLPKPEVAFVEFGAGADARWCVAAVERWKCPAIGIEIDPIRAAAARAHVRRLGLADRITIITGDAITTDVQADVGALYLYQPTIEAMKPRLEKLKAFASYIHKPDGLSVTKNGDSWLYSRPAVQQVASRPAQVLPRQAVWNGVAYSRPLCNNPNCAMCNGAGGIRAQLAAPVSAPTKAAQPRAVCGYYIKRCNGRTCWLEWVRG